MVESLLLEIPAEEFVNLLTVEARRLASVYAKRFVKELNAMDAPSDLIRTEQRSATSVRRSLLNRAQDRRESSASD